MTTSAVERKDGADTTPVTTPAPLDQFRAAALGVDAPIDAVLAYLRELANADEDALGAGNYTDGAMRHAAALGTLQGTLRGLVEVFTVAWSPAVRSAPPSGLAEVLADSSRLCRAPRCGEYVQPWEHDGAHCDPECAAEAAAAFGVDAS